MTRILFLAPATNYHTKKWCSYFVKKGYEVHVFSLTKAQIPDVNVHCQLSSNRSDKGDFSKLSYLFAVSKINKLYYEIKPDIVSVHYATSYGLLAALSQIKKYSLSVWGTDVYAFPNKSLFHKKIVEYSLSKATLLLSTSAAMAKECKKYTEKSFYITPFGVDMNVFSPKKQESNNEGNFVISNIKSLSPEYGIDILLKAIRETIDHYPDIRLHVNIAGNGPSADSLKQLSRNLGVEDYIEWMGFVPQEVIVERLSNSDVAIIPSFRESFGVSAVEAQACGIPVVITDIDGLKEATCPGKSSIVVEVGNYKALSKAIVDLYYDKPKRIAMGIFARKYVIEHFEYSMCFRRIELLLLSLLQSE